MLFRSLDAAGIGRPDTAGAAGRGLEPAMKIVDREDLNVDRRVADLRELHDGGNQHEERSDQYRDAEPVLHDRGSYI